MDEKGINHAAVAGLRCPLTQAALLHCEDQEVLSRLRKAFPECFGLCETFPLPLSEILDAVKEQSIAEWNGYGFIEVDQAINWYSDVVLRRLKVPIFEEWDEDAEVTTLPVPPEIQAQLRGKVVEVPMVVRWAGTDCIVVYLREAKNQDGSESPDEAELFRRGSRLPWDFTAGAVTLIAASLVDLSR